MMGRPATKQRHWLAEKYAADRAREDEEIAELQRQREAWAEEDRRNCRRRQSAVELGKEWDSVAEDARTSIIATLRHDAAALSEEGDVDFARAHEVAAKILEAMGA